MKITTHVIALFTFGTLSAEALAPPDSKAMDSNKGNK